MTFVKFKGRLIDECDEPPKAHIFSFDHITKKGKLLKAFQNN
jgi:hypothetical protein